MVNKNFKEENKENSELLDINNDSSVNKLVISSSFPPSKKTGGLVIAKRIISIKEKVDVIQIKPIPPLDDEFNEIVDKYINKRFCIDNVLTNTPEGINKFRIEGLKLIEKEDREYKEILSRSWPIDSHILALDYKLKHPNVYWTAEFSDPLLYDLANKRRYNSPFIQDKKYVTKINKALDEKNKSISSSDKKFIKIRKSDNKFFLGEYLPFVFADKVRFINSNQRELMLSQFDYDVTDYVMSKSEIKPHPIVPKELYFVKDSDYELNNGLINFAYFGTYVGRRHLEFLFAVISSLNPQIKENFKLHLFVSNKNFVKSIVDDLDILDNVEVNDSLPLLEFLNLTTKMDVLIVNDLITGEQFKVNPFLPSKLADYLGSGSDIWAICEEDSPMNRMDLKYKSVVDDLNSIRNTLISILNDKSDINCEYDSYFKDDFDIGSYLEDRVTNLNYLAYKYHKNYNEYRDRYNSVNKSNKKLQKENSKLKKEISKLKKQNKHFKSTKAYKVWKRYAKYKDKL